MRQKLIMLLKHLEAALPPPLGCHHSIMYSQFGSEETGLEDKLMLQILNDGVFISVVLDDIDFEKTNVDLIAEIVDLLKQPVPKNVQ